MWLAVVGSAVSERLAVRTEVVVSARVVVLRAADVTARDSGVSVARAPTERDGHGVAVVGHAVDGRRPAVVSSDLSVAEVRVGLRVCHSKLLVESGRELCFLREVAHLDLDGFEGGVDSR